MNRKKFEIINQADNICFIKYFNINRNLFSGILSTTIMFIALCIIILIKNIGTAIVIFILFMTLLVRFWYYAVLHCRIIIDNFNMIYMKDFIFRRKINRAKIQLAEIYEKDINRTKFSKEHSLFVLKVYVDGNKYNVLITTEKKDCYTVMELINKKIRITEN